MYVSIVCMYVLCMYVCMYVTMHIDVYVSLFVMLRNSCLYFNQNSAQCITFMVA